MIVELVTPAKRSFGGERKSSEINELLPKVEAKDMKHALTRSSRKERRGNALALGAEEGRDKLR